MNHFYYIQRPIVVSLKLLQQIDKKDKGVSLVFLSYSVLLEIKFPAKDIVRC